MRKKLLSLTLIFTFSIAAVPAFAQSSGSDEPSANTRETTEAITTETREEDPSITRREQNFERQQRLEELQEQRAIREQTAAERQAEIQALRAQAQSERCQTIQTNMLARVDFYRENRDRHIETHAQVIANVDQAIERLDEAGIDTTSLAAELEIARELVDQLRTELTTATDTLSSLADGVCEIEPQNLKNELEPVREQLAAARETSAAMRNQYDINVRQELETIRTQAEALSQPDNN